MISSAIISECGFYRYELKKIWQPKNGWVCWVLLNPSTADANQEDPTIRRCMGFAERWGYGGIVIANLFAYRATDPKKMLAVENPIGPENDWYIERLSFEADLTVCGWGNHGTHLNRVADVWRLLTKPHYLGLTKTGQPKHPLYLNRNLEPIKY